MNEISNDKNYCLQCWSEKPGNSRLAGIHTCGKDGKQFIKSEEDQKKDFDNFNKSRERNALYFEGLHKVTQIYDKWFRDTYK